MSCSSGPLISTTGLILNLDAASKQSYPHHPSTTDHGISEWYCFASCTVTYSCVFPYTTIYQVTSGGTITTVTTTSSVPLRGTFSATAGNRYYADKAINFVAEGSHFSIAPISAAGKVFIYSANRASYESGLLYFYSPFGAATVNVYKDSTGVSGTPVTTFGMTKAQVTTYATTALGNFFVTSTIPIVMSAKQILVSDGVSLADMTILTPAKNTSYNRYSQYNLTSINTAPATLGTYVNYDATYPVGLQTIADGSGGDTLHGLAEEFLCDRYSFGNILSDYVIVAPYANTEVTTYYWSGTAWVVWDSHSLSGTQLSPAYAHRDGTNGPGVAGALLSGLAVDMASGATLWKWESNKPIFLGINDSVDDEFAMLGWMKARETRLASDEDLKWYNTAKMADSPSLQDGVTYSSGSFVFDNTNDIVLMPNSTAFDLQAFTIEVWCKPYVLSHGGFLFEKGNVNTQYSVFFESNGYFYFRTQGLSTGDLVFQTSLYVTANQWNHMVFTCGAGAKYSYVNTVQAVQVTGLTGTISTNTGGQSIGAYGGYNGAHSYYFNGEIAAVRVYNRAITSTEVKNNFNTQRSRFGV